MTTVGQEVNRARELLEGLKKIEDCANVACDGFMSDKYAAAM